MIEYYEENRDKKLEYQKKYREQNKEEINQKHKKYREQNKEKINEINKKYNQEHKEQIKEKMNKQFNCECGGKYTPRNKARHFKSKLHQTYLQNIN